MEVNQQTIMAFVRLVCPLIASAAAMCGIAVNADDLFIVATCAVALVAFIWSWWKNNNVTKAAQEAQGYLNVIKKAEKVDRSDEEEAKG